MGALFSKKVEPRLSGTESWSTLQDFVVSEEKKGKRETISVQNVVKDEEIQQVQTWMNFPESRPKASLALDVHLDRSIHRSKTQMEIKDIPPSESSLNDRKQMDIDIKEGNSIELPKLNFGGEIPRPKHLMLKRTTSQINVIGNIKYEEEISNPVHSNATRQPTKLKIEDPNIISQLTPSPLEPSGRISQSQLERQINRSILNNNSSTKDDPDGLFLTVDANSRQEASNQQIGNQLVGKERLERKIQSRCGGMLKPKFSRSFYDLRRAMINRENVSLEQVSFVIKPVPPTIPEEEPKSVSLLNHSIASVSKKSSDSGIKTKYTINRELPPGFNILTETTKSEKQCRTLVETIKGNNGLRNEIYELLKMWKRSGFIESIEDYIKTIPPGKINSVSDIIEYITSSKADYMLSLSDNSVHKQLAKAYAIYFWVANIFTTNIKSLMDSEEHEEDPLNNIEHKTRPIDNSTFYVQLANLSNLEAEIIGGQVRTWRNTVQGHSYLTPHTWNVVRVGDVVLQLDCTLGSGSTSSSLGFVKSYTPDYFAVPPEHLILTHWPTDPEHQLLESSLSLQDIMPIIPVPITTLRQGILPQTWCETLRVPNRSQCPVVSVDIKTIGEHTISADLVPGPEIDVPHDSFNQNVYMRRVNNQWKIELAIPLKGQYKLNIFSKPGHKTDEDKSCLSYIISCDANTELKLGYPMLHEAASRYNLSLIYWNTPTQSHICQNMSGLLNVVFEANPGQNFNHYILPGRVANTSTTTIGNIKHYNTLLVSNSGIEVSLYQLQAVFPSNGWWTVYLSCDNKETTSLLTYYVYVTAGLPNNSYPRILVPHVTLNNIKPITSTGEDLLEMQFVSSKHLDFRHHLTFQQPTSEPLEGFSKINLEGKIKGYYIYSLQVIFSMPGNWYIHVSGKESLEMRYTKLFDLNLDVKGAKTNTYFIDYNKSIGDSLGFRILNDSFKFLDDGQPLSYSFEAMPHVNFYHTIKSSTNDSISEDYCTHLSSESSTERIRKSCYTLNAIFPSSGKWSVQLFAAKKECTNFSPVFSMNVRVSIPSPQLCYPKINSTFYQQNMKIDKEKALIKANKNGELELPLQLQKIYALLGAWNCFQLEKNYTQMHLFITILEQFTIGCSTLYSLNLGTGLFDCFLNKQVILLISQAIFVLYLSFV